MQKLIQAVGRCLSSTIETLVVEVDIYLDEAWAPDGQTARGTLGRKLVQEMSSMVKSVAGPRLRAFALRVDALEVLFSSMYSISPTSALTPWCDDDEFVSGAFLPYPCFVLNRFICSVDISTSLSMG